MHIKLEGKENLNHTWSKSITIAKRTFAASVKKLTLTGLNLKLPSTLDIKTKIGCQKKKKQLRKRRKTMLRQGLCIKCDPAQRTK